MPLAGGLRLGPYEILGPLGSGGMGEVYRARDVRLARDVAVKVLPSDDEGSAAQLARFESEARAVAALNHPNILALHDVGRHDGIVYAVTELLEGETLRDRLRQSGPFAPARAVEIAIQIVRGLAAAHDGGFVHRDLKPENLFITREGRVKILDFGLAREIAPVSAGDHSSTRFTTGPGMVVGTPGYISPEQMLGEVATARADIFAFGVVVYEMLTGRHPFRRATLTETTAAVLREDPPPLAQAVPGLGNGAAKMLQRCLEKHATDRPESARDLAIYLEAIGASADDRSAGGPSIDLRRLRVRIAAVSCAVLVLLSAATWLYVRTMAGRAVSAAINRDLAQAGQLVHRVQRDQLADLLLTARQVASIPELKALFATDAATIRDYLVSYQQRNPGAPLLLALGPDGRMIARTDDQPIAPAPDDWAVTLARLRDRPALVAIGGRPYHAAIAAAAAGGNLFGLVLAAVPVDAAFASALREATGDEVLLLSGDGVVVSTLRSVQAPWRSIDEWRRAGGGPDRAADVAVGAERFAARETQLATDPAVSAIVLASRDEAIAPFRRIQDGLIVLGLLSLVMAAIASIWIARLAGAALQR
jgi:hypothetical protein